MQVPAENKAASIVAAPVSKTKTTSRLFSLAYRSDVAVKEGPRGSRVWG